MKIREMVLAVNALSKLANCDLNIQTAYKLNQVVSIIQKEVDFFSNQRQKIFEKYGKLNEKKEFVIVNQNESEAEKAIEEILDIESEAKIIPIKIPITENIQLSVNDLIFLEPFITFYEPKEE